MIERSCSILMTIILGIYILYSGYERSNRQIGYQWPLSLDDLQKERGWYGLKVNNGPIQYFTTLYELTPILPFPCLSSIHEGDLLEVIITPHTCESYSSRLPSKTQLALGLKLNLNSLTEKEMIILPRIGKQLAQKIEQRKPWDSLDQLLDLKGIGHRTYQKLTSILSLEPPKVIWTMR